ncbi:MAG TPA: hypothetical protein VHZ76_04665 [Gammaproteobacteria bacterium]|jgi:hypothetical protein|nr:hypothetical protein [Gammaproteobacteria bacterium]
MEINSHANDEFLSFLLTNTPSSKIKLLSMWDSLPTNFQIKVLSNPSELTQELIEKALLSNNEIIRYLAARQAYEWFKLRNEKIISLINNDKCEAIKFQWAEKVVISQF